MTEQLKLQATSPLAAWLSYLETQHSQPIALGLERVAQVAARMGLQRPAPTVFTVAGTNGKGTTCRMLEAALLAAGFRVGVYSSPHLLNYNERVRLQGQPLADQHHSAAFAHIEARRGAVPLTYFEYGTLAALWLFEQARLDVAILEVGLGGRLDATNIVDADVALITSIDLDHTDWLGADRQTIGREKAGIFRRNRPAIVSENMPPSVADVATSIGAPLLACGRHWHYQHNGQSWQFTDATDTLTDLPLPQIPLANAACALAALRASGLTVPLAALCQAMRQASLPGRFQTVRQSPRLILDVAHNPHAAHWLAQRLAQEKRGKLLAVVGMLRDKDIAGTLANLANVVDSWYCASLDGPRGASGQQLVAHLPVAHLPATTIYDCPALALAAARAQAGAADTVLVCGSFYTVAQALQVLRQEEKAGGE